MKTFNDRNKLSPFECGFSTKDSARIPISIRFFLICLIFLIFDVELVLLFPFLTSTTLALRPSGVVLISLFLIILRVGLYYEWAAGILEWAKFNWIF